MAEVTVVVPARNASATIGATLDALSAQRVNASYEVIVVDSGSRDNTPAIVERSGVARLLRNADGEPASSRNLGAAQASGSVLAFTDADCVPAPDWIANGIRALEGADIVQGRVEPLGPCGPFDRTVEVRGEYGLYETANLFFKRDTFERAGGFAPVLQIAGTEAAPFGEDAWLVWRAKRRGARTTFAGDALVQHAVFPRSWLGAVAEETRCRHFPALVALIPELRRHFLHHRLFLTPQSELFDLAIAGAVASALTRRRWPALLLGAVYLRDVGRQVRYANEHERLEVGVARVAADAIRWIALVYGNVRSRSVVL